MNNKLKILIIDDNASIHQDFINILSEHISSKSLDKLDESQRK